MVRCWACQEEYDGNFCPLCNNPVERPEEKAPYLPPRPIQEEKKKEEGDPETGQLDLAGSEVESGIIPESPQPEPGEKPEAPKKKKH